MSWRWERFVWWLTQPPVATPVAVLDVYPAGEWVRINGRLRKVVGRDPKRYVWWVA